MAEHDKPVAWIDKHGNIDTGWDAILDSEGWTPLYTRPAQWVGLTDYEIKEIIGVLGDWGPTPIKGYTRWLFDKIEAKLKEKNT